MRAERIVARGFRNLADLDLPLPPGGAVFLGPNGHGKTNLLELLYYPVLFRSVRGARDVEVTRHGESGFQLVLSGAVGQRGSGAAVAQELSVRFRAADRRKSVLIDGVPPERLSEAIGHWLAVAFLPTDLRLVQGSALERRQYLDRVLALADRRYLRALSRYRRALAHRNAALRQQRPEVGAAFDEPLATAGTELVQQRLAWTRQAAGRVAAECDNLGELEPMALGYRGDESLADLGQWPAALRRSATRDQRLGMTTVGPHRHDLELRLGNRLLREVGSTGQQRTAAVGLKLCERATLAAASGGEPALLLDDLFAELDSDRRKRLAARLATRESGAGAGDEAGRAPQTFITSPRDDELPECFHLELLSVKAGRAQALSGFQRRVA